MKVNIDINRQIVLFVCSPSLGLLDSWISILIPLRKKLPRAQFIFIAPRTKLISEINLQSVLFQMANNVFDLVVFKSQSNTWLCSDTFKNAKKINSYSTIKIFHYGMRALEELNFNSLRQLLSKIYMTTVSVICSKFLFEINKIKKTKYLTLFDLYELDKPYNKDLHKIISNQDNFSLIHGVNPRGIQHESKKKIIDAKKTKLFALSERELEHYKNTYALNPDQMKVYGIPRHEKKWIENILKKEDSELSDNKYIFLISRPISTYLPYDKKKQFLEMIKIAAEKFDLKVVIKLHPKEETDKIFTEIFGQNRYKKNWEFSDKHPFVLGKNCEFAISFYSGVPIDLIILGVPSIELLDLKGIKEYDNEFSLRDSKGEPVFNLRYLNLIKGTSSYIEFERYIKEILNDRNSIVDKLKKEYKKVFPVIENVNQLIVEEIYKNNSFKDCKDIKN